MQHRQSIKQYSQARKSHQSFDKSANKIQMKKQLKHERKKYNEIHNISILACCCNKSCRLTTTQKIILMIALAGAIYLIINSQTQNNKPIILNKDNLPANDDRLITPRLAAITHTTIVKKPAFIPIAKTLPSNSIFKVNNPPAPPIKPQPTLELMKQEGRNYKNIPIIEISVLKQNCTKKVRGHSDGKICIIEEKKYYMKLFEDDHQNQILGFYNIKFIKNNIGITVPNAQIFSENAKFYFASEAVPDFVSASSLNSYKKDPNKYRDMLVEKIGENGISKLMVATTFIDDLNLDNWGYDKNGLVIVDMDRAPRTLEEYILNAKMILESNSVPLTLNNIKEMREIYITMQTKPLPTIDATVDITPEFYQLILNVYIQSCELIMKDFHFSTLNERTPSSDINKNFEQNIAKIGYQILRSQTPKLPNCI